MYFKTFKIHDAESLSAIDLAVSAQVLPIYEGIIYIVYIEDGVAHVKSKPLPYRTFVTWDYEFELAPADDVAIEFNGVWERNPESKRFDFIAEEKPWLFWLKDGVIKAQHWKGE